MTAGEQLATRLQQLISQSAIEQVSIYRFSDHKLHPQSEQWSFGYELNSSRWGSALQPGSIGDLSGAAAGAVIIRLAKLGGLLSGR